MSTHSLLVRLMILMTDKLRVGLITGHLPLKEVPAEAEIVSHQLMLRAGLIRRLASGLFTWMPLGSAAPGTTARTTHAEARRIDDSGLARAIPLHTRFRARSQPIVGTSLDYFELRGLITVKDIQKAKDYPDACRDDHQQGGGSNLDPAGAVQDESIDRHRRQHNGQAKNQACIRYD